MSATRLQNCLTQLRSRAGDKKNANGASQYFQSLVNLILSFCSPHATILTVNSHLFLFGLIGIRSIR